MGEHILFVNSRDTLVKVNHIQDNKDNLIFQKGKILDYTL